jgi:hypothetical protein
MPKYELLRLVDAAYDFLLLLATACKGTSAATGSCLQKNSCCYWKLPADELLKLAAAFR